jgi:NAD(P)H-nitrite reductase large subunit
MSRTPSPRVSSAGTAGSSSLDAAGERHTYDALVIATGSRTFIPPIDGIDQPHVLAFRTLADVKRISRAARGARTAVVIGGGLLGLEAAAGLIGYGIAITVVETRHGPERPAQSSRPSAHEADSSLVCRCAMVTRETIVTAIEARRLRSVAEVSAATGAATGCGSCVLDVAALLTADVAWQIPRPPHGPRRPSSAERPESWCVNSVARWLRAPRR